MIDEKVLERLLQDEAATYVPPAGGPDRVLAAAAVERPAPPFPRLGWIAAVAAVGIALVAVPLVRDGTVGSMPTSLNGGGTSADGGKQLYDSGGRDAANDDAQAGPRIVRTGDVSLHVGGDEVAETLRAATRIAAAHGGFVAESAAETFDGSRGGYVTIRVPAAAFDKAVEDVGRLGEVVSSTTQTEDVTDQVTDVEARLKSLTATRGQLQALLAKARDVGEVLAVQEQMTEVQTQIEQLQARQKSLADRTAYGTLRVGVNAPGSGEPRGGFGKAWDDAVNGFVGGFQWLVAASGTIAFLLIVGAVLLLLGRRAYRYWVRGVV